MLFTTVYSLWINEQSVYPPDCIPSPLLRKQLPVFAVKYRTKYVIATYKTCGFATLKSSLQLLRGMWKSLGHDEEAGRCSVLALAASVRAQIAPGAQTAMAAEHAEQTMTLRKSWDCLDRIRHLEVLSWLVHIQKMRQTKAKWVKRSSSFTPHASHPDIAQAALAFQNSKQQPKQHFCLFVFEENHTQLLCEAKLSSSLFSGRAGMGKWW